MFPVITLHLMVLLKQPQYDFAIALLVIQELRFSVGDGDADGGDGVGDTNIDDDWQQPFYLYESH